MVDRTPLPAPRAVLMYHDLVDPAQQVTDSHRPYALPTERFRSHLTLLKKEGVAARRLDRSLGPDVVNRSRVCIITFDDGHESNCTLALPLLLEMGVTATFFITVGWIGTPPYMSWSQVRSLADAGMEIGSHSMTHRPPTLLTPEELRREMLDSRKMLEDRLGQPIISASSPTGFFNPAMIPAARAAGYQALCYGRIALWKNGVNRYAIPRIPVKRHDSADRVLRMVLGDRSVLLSMRARQMVRNGLKSGLGVERYLRVRRFILERLRGRSAE